MKIDFFFLNFSIHPITAGERDDIKQYLFKKTHFSLITKKAPHRPSQLFLWSRYVTLSNGCHASKNIYLANVNFSAHLLRKKQNPCFQIFFQKLFSQNLRYLLYSNSPDF